MTSAPLTFQPMEGQFDWCTDHNSSHQSKESLTSPQCTMVYCLCTDTCTGDKTSSEGGREGKVLSKQV